MKELSNISIIGGDLRLAYLANILQKEFQVYIYGNDHKEIKSSIQKCDSLSEAIEKSEIIIFPIPFSNDKVNIYAPFYEESIPIKSLNNNDIKNKQIIGGAFLSEFKTNDYDLLDLADDDEFSIYNAIPTGEGVLNLMMQNSEITIYGSRCLILGYGRCGIIQGKLLDGLKAKITIAARNYRQLALAAINGFDTVHINELNNIIDDYDFIINTIPSNVLEMDKLKTITHDTVVIDIANQLFNTIINDKVKVINARGIPGRYSPKTAAEIIYKTITEKGYLK